MTKAYFEYNPVGSSLLAIEQEDKTFNTTSFNVEKPQDLIGVIATMIDSNGVNQLYCNKPGLELGSNIREFLLKEYNYTACEILLNK